MAERACLALCRHMAAARTDLHLSAPLRWLESTQGCLRDNDAWATAWKAWRDAGCQPASEPDYLLFGIPMWSRCPPLPPLWMLYGNKRENHPGNCCPVCRCSTYQGGDWRASAGKPRWNKTWHAPCLHAHLVWTRTPDYARVIAEQQGGVCALSGESIMRDGHLRGQVEVDHLVPLWRVRHDAAQYRWPDVLRFWGLGNLQALSAAGHRIKTAREAAERAALNRRPLTPSEICTK